MRDNLDYEAGRIDYDHDDDGHGEFVAALAIGLSLLFAIGVIAVAGFLVVLR